MKGLVNFLSEYTAVLSSGTFSSAPAPAAMSSSVKSTESEPSDVGDSQSALLCLPLDVRLEIYKQDYQNFYREIAETVAQAAPLICFNTIAKSSLLSKVSHLWKDGARSAATKQNEDVHSWKRFVSENVRRQSNGQLQTAVNEAPNIWAKPNRATELLRQNIYGADQFIPFFGKKTGGLSAKHLCYNLMFQEPYVLGKFEGITAGKEGIGSGARFRIQQRLVTLSPIGSALQFSKDSSSLLNLLERSNSCCFLCDVDDPTKCVEELRTVFSMTSAPLPVTILAFGGEDTSLITLAESLGLLAMIETMPEFRACIARVHEEDLQPVSEALNWIVV